jgi:hypothetical protein
MPEYRLYELQADGEATGAPYSFFATSDEVAISHSQGQRCPEGCELWEGERLVAKVGPKRERPSHPGEGAPA